MEELREVSTPMKCWAPSRMPLERTRDPIVFYRIDGVPAGTTSHIVPQGGDLRDVVLAIAAEVLSSGTADH
jgi:hypothetical protein